MPWCCRSTAIPGVLQSVIALLPTAALGEGLRAYAVGGVPLWPLLSLLIWSAPADCSPLGRVSDGRRDRTPRSPAAGVLRLVSGDTALRRWAMASLVANIGIVVTGGVVRLTASGLGCPTWPRCTEDAYVAHPELGLHGAIEFGNRLLTFVLIVIAVLTWVTAMRAPPRRHHRGAASAGSPPPWRSASPRRACSAASPC